MCVDKSHHATGHVFVGDTIAIMPLDQWMGMPSRAHLQVRWCCLLACFLRLRIRAMFPGNSATATNRAASTATREHLLKKTSLGSFQGCIEGRSEDQSAATPSTVGEESWIAWMAARIHFDLKARRWCSWCGRWTQPHSTARHGTRLSLSLSLSVLALWPRTPPMTAFSADPAMVPVVLFPQTNRIMLAKRFPTNRYFCFKFGN